MTQGSTLERTEELRKGNLPLSGIRVLDFTWVVSGPQATRILADFGAEIIKIERRTGEQSRDMTFNPQVFATRGMFVYFNRNKNNIALNIAGPEGKDILKRLIEMCDVVICNFSARVMERWGFDWEGIKKINPKIVYVSMPGFGHTGLRADYQSNGPTLQALSGQTWACGLPDQPSAGWGYSYMDHTAGYYGAAAVLQGLYYRGRSGNGQFIDLAQFEAAVNLLGTYILDRSVNGRPNRRPGQPAGNKGVHPRMAPHGVYQCAGDDNWSAIAVRNDQDWQRMKTALGNPAWADAKFDTLVGRLANEAELDREIEAWTKSKTGYEVMEALQSAGVPAGAVQNPRMRADEDPQLAARGQIVWMKTEGTESGKVRVDGLPMKITSIDKNDFKDASVTGGDADYVYGQLLGMSKEQMADYAARGII